MKAEERIFSGVLFAPGDPELAAIKLKTHNLNNDYNATYEHETEKRSALLADMLGAIGEDSFEGVYFGMLKDALADADPQTQQQIMLAAKLSRQILDGQEVALP